MTSSDLTGFIRLQLQTPSTQWNLGTFGAIAEFLREPGEPVVFTDEPGRLAATTARGGIGFGDLSGVKPFASETPIGESWHHRVALCLPAEACAMHRRTTLTALGPDTGALRAEDRSGLLFDMGLGTLQADICIRTADPELTGLLLAHCGRPLFEAGNPAMAAIVAAGPHRVFITRFARCEVFQPIPPANGKSPEGPHTHVLPKLLRTCRTHAANEPVPEGLVPCVHLVPAHPTRDALGQPRAWDAAAHAAFQDLLARFGDPQLLALKTRLASALAAGHTQDAQLPAARYARHAAKVLLRQVQAASGSQANAAWAAALDDVDEPDDYAHA